MGTEALAEQWSEGTEVLAMYSFKGNSGEDLPFSRKDVLTIVRPTKDKMWYWARDKKGKEGMIPANYVQKRGEVKLSTMPWFHGKIGREEAEKLLTKENGDGVYLVRESNTFPGDYTLCVSHFDEDEQGRKVEHYRVLNKDNKLTIDEEGFFVNLIDLVQHYESDADGLCTRLICPLAKSDGHFEVAVDKRMFQDQGWTIKIKDLKEGETLGKGEFGSVKKGRYNGMDVAIKELREEGRALQQFLAEASVMTALQHSNLVQLIGVVLGDTTKIVTEYMAKGNLVDYLRSRGRAIITLKDQIGFACDASSGMAYLESKAIVHRDLAARNILISQDNIAKVSDFGLARHEDSYFQGGKFPIKWTAPEAMRNSKFTNKSDVWSFGILLWEIYSFGRIPYPRIPLADVVMHVERGYRMDPPDGCPSEIYDVMQETWQLDPAKRPDFKDIHVKLERIKATTV